MEKPCWTPRLPQSPRFEALVRTGGLTPRPVSDRQAHSNARHWSSHTCEARRSPRESVAPSNSSASRNATGANGGGTAKKQTTVEWGSEHRATPCGAPPSVTAVKVPCIVGFPGKSTEATAEKQSPRGRGGGYAVAQLRSTPNIASQRVRPIGAPDDNRQHARLWSSRETGPRATKGMGRGKKGSGRHRVAQSGQEHKPSDDFALGSTIVRNEKETNRKDRRFATGMTHPSRDKVEDTRTTSQCQWSDEELSRVVDNVQVSSDTNDTSSASGSLAIVKTSSSIAAENGWAQNDSPSKLEPLFFDLAADDVDEDEAEFFPPTPILPVSTHD